MVISEAQDKLKAHWLSFVDDESKEADVVIACTAMKSVDEWIDLYHDLVAYEDDYFDRESLDGYSVMRELINLFHEHFQEVLECLTYL